MNASRGLNFVTWDLMLDSEKITESGTYNLKLEGPNFIEEKTFEVKKMERRR